MLNHLIYIILTFLIGLLTGWSSFGFYKKTTKALKSLRASKNKPELESV